MDMAAGALGGIGDTPLVELRRMRPDGGAKIVAKLEWANPTGSMKDRMAKTAIEGAIRDGRLEPGGTVVEYTAGTTGISLAFVCAALGYRLHVVFSDAFSMEKRRTMLAFGAEVENVPSDAGQITEALIKEMIAPGGPSGANRIEGIGAGTSSGANVHAAIEVAQRLGPDATVATILCDSGLRYLSTELYASV